MSAIRNYVVVTAAYWGFTLTDGALRMLVLLHFYQLGYNAIQLAFLFLFYEFFGIVTNLVGGWIGAHIGVKTTLVGGLTLQVIALAMLTIVDPGWSLAMSVTYVMGTQALSGIAKDLTKMSAKSAIKALVPEGANSRLFRWVALLTGSKNALKGVGFFLGGFLLATVGYSGALWSMAGALAVIVAGSALSLPRHLGRAQSKTNFLSIFSKSRDINVLSAARFFLFGARDVWFVVGVPVFLASVLGWSFTQVGSFLAAWVIGYGIIQAGAPAFIALWTRGRAPQGLAAFILALALAATMAAIPIALRGGFDPRTVVLTGLAIVGLIFALNSSVHSYLILAYSDGDKVALNVGFYYMANAGGRLTGTLLSGVMYQAGGLESCLWTSTALAVVAACISTFLPRSTEVDQTR